MSEFVFSHEQFATMFPYYICLDKQQQIESYGNYIPQLCGIEKGKQFNSLFTCIKKSGKSSSPTDVVPVNEIIIIQSLTAVHINFKGKFEYLDKDNRMIFLGTPSYVIGNDEIDLQFKLFNNSYENKLFSGNNLFLTIKYSNLEDVVNYFKEKEYTDSFNTPKNKESNYAITISDNDGCVVWCNKYFEELSGRPYDEVIGKRPRDAIYGKRSVYIDKNFVDYNVLKGEPFYFENIGYTKEGKEFWFGVVVHPVFNTQNEIIGRVHLLKDISVSKLRQLQTEENENLLLLSLEASRVGAWSYDVISEEINVSDLYKSIVGYRKEGRLTSADYMEMMHPEDQTIFNDIIVNKITPTTPSFAFETRYKVDGVYRYFNVRGKCIQWGGNGKPIKLVGTLRDVNDERTRVMELEKQKQFYHNIIDRIPADLVLLTLDHKYSYINKKAVKNDETREWLIGKDDYDYCKLKGIPESFADQRRKAFDSVLKNSETVQYLETQRKDDEDHYLMRIFSPLFNEEGNLDLVIGYGVDVTEQVKNERYALLQENRIKNFLDIARDGIFSCTLDGVLKTCNRSFLRILNIEDGLKKGINFYSLLAQEEQIILKDKITLLINTGQAQNGIFTIEAHPGGDKLYIDYTLILDAKEGMDTFVGRISDITELVMKERNMQQIIEHEVQLNKNKSQFMHITSHELRTPLTIIQSNSELLELIYTKPELLAKKNPLILTHRIIKEVDLMTDILNQLMLVSKIESGSVDFNPETVDVAGYIDTVAATFRPYSDGRYLEIEIQEGISSWFFDTKIMKHALVNLISNAFKYSYNKKSPRLAVAIVEGKLTFTITDSGIGIPEPDMKSLFQSFFRASNVGVISGTGIGLMVVEYAVKKHNGTIKVSSILNKGSEFTISLP